MQISNPFDFEFHFECPQICQKAVCTKLTGIEARSPMGVEVEAEPRTRLTHAEAAIGCDHCGSRRGRVCGRLHQ